MLEDKIREYLAVDLWTLPVYQDKRAKDICKIVEDDRKEYSIPDCDNCDVEKENIAQDIKTQRVEFTNRNLKSKLDKALNKIFEMQKEIDILLQNTQTVACYPICHAPLLYENKKCSNPKCDYVYAMQTNSSEPISAYTKSCSYSEPLNEDICNKYIYKHGFCNSCRHLTTEGSCSLKKYNPKCQLIDIDKIFNALKTNILMVTDNENAVKMVFSDFEILIDKLKKQKENPREILESFQELEKENSELKEQLKISREKIIAVLKKYILNTK